MNERQPTIQSTSCSRRPPARRAHGLMRLQVLTYACEVRLEDPADACGQSLLDVAAEDLHRFLTRPGGG